MSFHKIIDQLSRNPRKLFLIDGLGAIASAFTLGVVLTALEPLFGIPRAVLYFLATLPVIFAIYDFYCYWQINSKFGQFVRIIALANIFYCGISLGLAFFHRQKLTYLGWFYIVLEIVIVLALAYIELKTAAAISSKEAMVLEERD